MFNLNSYLQKYQPIIEAIVDLFHPFVEAAVHDLESGKIVAIYNNISRRKVGDNSPLRELNIPIDQLPEYFTPYYKENWDGRSLKCTSITIYDLQKKAIALICFNFDTTFFQGIQTQLTQFLSVNPEADNPINRFGKDWQKQISEFMDEYFYTHHLSLDHLTRQQKKDLVQHLNQKGVFNYKNAASYVAQKLKISRASIYNYLA